MDKEQIRIGVLTYKKHRKTYDTLCLLKARGYKNVTVFAQPFTYQKKKWPLITHRPGLIVDIPEPADLAANLGYKYIEGAFADTILTDSHNGNAADYEDVREDRKDRIFLLCGAGLLPDSFIASHRIVNSHPGFIPLARGLDSYKWSLYLGLTIGVTTHFLGVYVDGGEVIERREIRPTPYDTFHSVAQRVYENEIDMLVGALERLDEKHIFIVPDENIAPFRRMPEDKERELIERFGIGMGFTITSEAEEQNTPSPLKVNLLTKAKKDQVHTCRSSSNPSYVATALVAA